MSCHQYEIRPREELPCFIERVFTMTRAQVEANFPGVKLEQMGAYECAQRWKEANKA